MLGIFFGRGGCFGGFFLGFFFFFVRGLLF